MFTFLLSDFRPAFPDDGRVVTVKLFGSSQSRILDSFISESSFFFAIFSTLFLLVDAYKQNRIIKLGSDEKVLEIPARSNAN